MKASQLVVGVEEGLLTLKELSEEPEVQRARLKYSRIRHWAFVGINGQKLPTVRIGGIRYTTVEKVLRFATECACRNIIESQDVGLPTTIPTEADAWHKRLHDRLYGGKNGKCNLKKTAK